MAFSVVSSKRTGRSKRAKWGGLTFAWYFLIYAMRPKLQVALDLSEARQALRLARLVKPYIDIIEAGTPLIKALGLKIVTQLKKHFPDRLLVADMKTADVGALESRLAFRAGADITTVLGGAPLPTIEAAIRETRSCSRQILVDMIGIKTLAARAREIVPLKPDYLGIHTGIDEQKSGTQPLAQLSELGPLGIPLAVAGGINLLTLDLLVEMPVAIIIVGSAITTAPSPQKAARLIRERIAALWPG